MENKQDKGFTLVELLIVIVILGILATITVFAVRGITDQGQTSACEADQKTMQTASEAFFAQYGGDTIPTGDDDLPVGMTEAGFAAGADEQDTLKNVGLIVDSSENVDVSPEGVVTATPLGDCVDALADA